MEWRRQNNLSTLWTALLYFDLTLKLLWLRWILLIRETLKVELRPSLYVVCEYSTCDSLGSKHLAWRLIRNTASCSNIKLDPRIYPWTFLSLSVLKIWHICMYMCIETLLYNKFTYAYVNREIHTKTRGKNKYLSMIPKHSPLTLEKLFWNTFP